MPVWCRLKNFLGPSLLVTVSKDIEKANVLGNFFSSVFTEEQVYTTDIPQKSAHIIMNTINFDEEIVLDKLSHLKTTKSSGPDNIHPRILLPRDAMLARY